MADCYNLEWPRLVVREFRFEDLGVRARFGPLPDVSGSVVDPHPATDGVSRELLEPVEQRGISAVDEGNIESVLFAHQGVRAPLAAGRHIPADHERCFGVHERKGARRR